MSSQPNAKTYAERAQAEPTDLHRNFAEWIKEQTGYEPDLKTVQIVCAMRMDFQRSEENQKHLKDRKAKAEALKKQRAAEKKARLEAQLAKLQAELAKETAPVEPAEKPAAKKTTPARTRKAPVKAATPTPAEPAKAAEAPAKARTPRARTRKTAAPKSA